MKKSISTIFEEARQTKGFAFECLKIDIMEEICAVMQEKGITRQELTIPTGFSEAKLRRLFRCNGDMKISDIVQICYVLGIKAKFSVEAKK